MSKQWLFNLITTSLLILGFFLWVYSYAKLKEEVINLKADNLALQEQVKAKEEAAELRQEEYQKLETEYNQLNQQMEDIKDEASIHWLNGAIPDSVDNTIPY